MVLMFTVVLIFWSEAGEAIQSNTVTLEGRWIWLFHFRKQRGITEKCERKANANRTEAIGKEKESSALLGINLLRMTFLQVTDGL